MVIQQQTIRPIPSAWRKISSWLSYKFWYKEHKHREETSLDLHTVLLIMSLVSVHHHTHIFTNITWLTQIIRIVGISLRIVLNAFVLWVLTLYTPGHYKTKQSKSSLFMTRHWSIITPNNCHRLHWQLCYWTHRPHTLTFAIYHVPFCQSKTKGESLYNIFRWNITYLHITYEVYEVEANLEMTLLMRHPTLLMVKGIFCALHHPEHTKCNRS